MGAGGRGTVEETRTATKVSRAPSTKPPFTVGELRKAIPPHCFKRSLLRSGSYLGCDLAVISALLYFASHIQTVQGPLEWVLWGVYWVLQGCVATGLWVLAHECGHHAFSEYEWVDDVVGFIFHSSLLVPYFSWKYSHRRHHSNTASLARDEVFVPGPKDSNLVFLKSLLQSVPGRVATIAFTLLAGWPSYLWLNVSGRHYDSFANHFTPNAPIFNSRERNFVLLSDVGLLAVCYGLFSLAQRFGVLWVVKVYGVPLLIVNGFLVLITFLQHTHPALPHYDSEEWDWLRGALSTVDRDYGILNHVLHHITDTHVAHHIFSTMPHYHASEATRCLKPVLGEYYQFDDTPVIEALWRETTECVYVEPDADSKQAGIVWYNKEF